MAVNYEARDIFSLGPKFRITTNDIEVGADGKSVYSLYSYNDNNDVNLMSFSESGAFRILNDRTIEIIAGNKSSGKSVDIVIAGRNGDVTITASCGSGRILMKANKIDQVGLTGNAITNTFGARCFAKSPVGAEYITDVFVGGTDVNIGIA
jgi:hypothetical protein